MAQFMQEKPKDETLPEGLPEMKMDPAMLEDAPEIKINEMEGMEFDEMPKEMPAMPEGFAMYAGVKCEKDFIEA